jgi:hypothetical protein
VYVYGEFFSIYWKRQSFTNSKLRCLRLLLQPRTLNLLYKRTCMVHTASACGRHLRRVRQSWDQLRRLKTRAYVPISVYSIYNTTVYFGHGTVFLVLECLWV